MKIIRDENRLLTKIAQMYYEENKTQQEIAYKYNISRPTVSRLLQKARKKGIVEIKIHNELSFTKLERKLEKKYDLKEVIITPSAKGEYLKQILAEAAAGYLIRVLKDGDIIGISWGTTLAHIPEYINNEARDVLFVPLVGGVGQLRLDIHSNQIVLNLARGFKGKWQLLHAPAIVDSEDVKKTLLSDTNIRKSLEIAANANIAVVGIGAPLAPGSTISETGYYTEDVLVQLKQAGATGDICSVFIDAEGKVCNAQINKRTIGISIQDLLNIPVVAGVAGGKDKHEAVLAALKGRYINVLITDEITGEFLLNN